MLAAVDRIRFRGAGHIQDALRRHAQGSVRRRHDAAAQVAENIVVLRQRHRGHKHNAIRNNHLIRQRGMGVQHQQGGRCLRTRIRQIEADAQFHMNDSGNDRERGANKKWVYEAGTIRKRPHHTRHSSATARSVDGQRTLRSKPSETRTASITEEICPSFEPSQELDKWLDQEAQQHGQLDRYQYLAPEYNAQITATPTTTDANAREPGASGGRPAIYLLLPAPVPYRPLLKPPAPSVLWPLPSVLPRALPAAFLD